MVKYHEISVSDFLCFVLSPRCLAIVSSIHHLYLPSLASDTDLVTSVKDSWYSIMQYSSHCHLADSIYRSIKRMRTFVLGTAKFNVVLIYQYSILRRVPNPNQFQSL